MPETNRRKASEALRMQLLRRIAEYEAIEDKNAIRRTDERSLLNKAFGKWIAVADSLASSGLIKHSGWSDHPHPNTRIYWLTDAGRAALAKGGSENDAR